MKKYFALLVVLILPFVSSAQAVPDFPMSFWGTVTVDGVAAPAGSVVRAYSSGVKVGEVVVSTSGVYGYDDVTKQKLLVSGGDVLSFSLQSPQIANGAEIFGIVPVTHNKFVSGTSVQKNLNFQTQIVSSGGGSSSGGGGGGGGGSSKTKKVSLTPATTTPKILGVATSTLSIEEKKMELQKQIIALLLQLIAILQQQK